MDWFMTITKKNILETVKYYLKIFKKHENKIL